MDHYLSKNPEFADRFLKIALEKKYGSVELKKLDDTFELKAKEHIINRFKK